MNHDAAAQRLDGDLDNQICAVSSSLQGSVRPIVEGLIGASHRPVALARRLGIDKSLTGRIMRSVKANDPFEIIHNAPAPYGLRIFLNAALAAGIGEELREKAEAAITEFELLIGTFPQGRSALEAAISDHIPEVRRRNERTAKQALYKSMSYLLGYQAESSFVTTILSPTPCGGMVDSTHIGGLMQLRRLRGDSPVNIFGVRRYDMQPGTPTWMETLDGERGVQDANRYLIKQYCDNPVPRLIVRDEGNALYSALDAKSLPINSPVTLVNGWINRNASLRYQNDSRTHEWHTSFLRIPTRVLIQDYFIHKDIWASTPQMQVRMHGLVTDSMRSNIPGRQHDEIDMETPLASLGMGLDSSELRHPDVPHYQTVIRDGFATINLDPDRFRAYRCLVVYPIPFVSLTAWFRLPVQPANDGL